MFGCFVGLFLIMYTKHKWLWTGLFNVFGGLVAFTAWWIPPNGKTLFNELTSLIIYLIQLQAPIELFFSC